MRVLIVGGAGFIGARVAPALARLGHSALIVSRNALPGVEHIVADRTDPAALARLASSHKCDAAIDMIAYEPIAASALRDALRGAIGRYALISSADVYRNYGGLHRTETADPDAMLTEGSPLRTRLYPYRGATPRAADDPLAWHDTYDKIPVEQALAGPDTTILRLPMVYGPGDPQRRFRWLLAPMRAHADQIAAPAAWLDWRTTYAFVADAAAAIALCATHERAAGRTYHCGERSVPNRDWIARFATLTGWRGAVVEDEENAFAKSVAAVLDLRFPLALDTSSIRGELGFTEPTSPEEALRCVIADEAAR